MAIFATIMSFISSDLFKKVLPYLLVGLLIIGGSYLIWNNGYNYADNEWQAKNLVSQLAGEKTKNENLQKQYDESLVTIANLKKQKENNAKNTNDVIKNIYIKVPVNESCDIGLDVIDELNKVRE